MGVGRGGARERAARTRKRLDDRWRGSLLTKKAQFLIKARLPFPGDGLAPQLAVAVESRRDFKNSARTLFDYHSLRPGILIWQLLQQNKTDATELRQCTPS